MADTVFTPQSTALITGAASGIGLAIARLCRRHGMNLALVDNNAAHLALAKESLSQQTDTTEGATEGDKSTITETYEMDVGDLAKWEELRESVRGRFPEGRVDLLVLNAGMSRKGGWENAGYFRETLQTNLFGILNGIHTFLPLIQSQQSQRPSAIVLTGSKQGITNPPGNPAYNASKAAVKSLAEHLSYDMRGSATTIHLLVPGWTFTGLSGGGPSNEGRKDEKKKQKPDGAWTPSQVADFLKERMDEGKFWAICPDNDVSSDTDRRRMLYSAGDAVFDRPPLSRWREEFRESAGREMREMTL